MKIPIYQIDAFTGRVFSGNPAAVCPLEDWLDESVLQAIAQENNLSETAFFVPEKDGYRIRWFTPVAEVDLCGHATLATAFVLFSSDTSRSEITFFSKKGKLNANRDQDLISLDFPSQTPAPCQAPKNLLEALKTAPLEVLSSEDYFVVFSSEKDVAKLNPDMGKLQNLKLRGVIATAKGENADFVSRFFGPKFGIDEDPVTGSAHCSLTPYWAGKLNKNNLYAQQISKRGGELYCINRGNRVVISGRAVKYMEGSITI